MKSKPRTLKKIVILIHIQWIFLKSYYHFHLFRYHIIRLSGQGSGTKKNIFYLRRYPKNCNMFAFRMRNNNCFNGISSYGIECKRWYSLHLYHTNFFRSLYQTIVFCKKTLILTENQLIYFWTPFVKMELAVSKTSNSIFQM